MEDIKIIIARNLADLRRRRGMTQLELAERLNYSDKAVSKWERGESIPDITVLKNIADMFEVTVDYLITAEHPEPVPAPTPAEETVTARPKRSLRNRGFITGMCVVLVWLIATLLFVILDSAMNITYAPLMPFIFAVPVSMIVWLILNSIWFNRRRNFLIISLLMWSVLISVYVSILLGGHNLWLLFALGLPGQVIILMWSGIRKRGIPATEAPAKATAASPASSNESHEA
jgi:transcriptional regulator with XRE-family HTH domain